MCKLLYVVLVNFTMSSPIPVDVQYNSAGIPYIPNAIVPGLSAASQTEVHLGIGRASFIDIGSDVSVEGILTGEIFTRNMITLCSSIDPASRYRNGHFNTLITVGIGPGNTLIERYASISVIRNGTVNGQMILGGQLAAFNQSCVAGSVLRIPFNYTAQTAIHRIRLDFRLSFLDRVIPTNLTGPAGFGGNSNIATLPYAFAVVLSLIIVQSGASRADQSGTNLHWFRQCNSDILLSRLPDLVLGLGDHSGELVLGPEDYIHFDNCGNQCWFKLGVESVNTQVWLFNPLVIPGVNVHITNSEIFICDSAH